MSSEIEARASAAQSSAGQKMRPRELAVMATATLILLCAEAFTSNPAILFGRDVWIDELWTKLIASEPGIWHSLAILAHSGDPTPPTYHILARASWWLSALMGGTGETAFRALAFAGVWLALVLTYAVLRRTFAILPSLIAVLLLWASPVTVKYAFFARPYGILLASTAAFCLLYCAEDFRPIVALMTAAASVLVCTLHYFGIFALGSIVFGDLITRRESFRDRLRRVLPAVAGPFVLFLLLPLVRAQSSGLDQASYLPAITLNSAVDTLIAMFYVPILVSVVLILAWWISDLRPADYPDRVLTHSTMTIQRVAGFSALLLVPVAVLMFSIFKANAFVDRYMITALLGFTPLAAMVASHSSRWLQLTILGFVIVLSGSSVRQWGAEMADWQTSEDYMMNDWTVMARDGLPIVSWSSHEAYILYEYAPALRKQLFIVDLRPVYRNQLSENVLNDNAVSAKWYAVHPDLPKLVTLDELAQMGKFHMVLRKEMTILMHQAPPFQRLEGMGQNAVFRVDPGYRGYHAVQGKAGSSH